MNITNIAHIVLLLVQLAEYIITGTKMGQTRKEKVVAWFYDLLPEAVTKIISRDKLDDMIEDAVQLMKQQLAQAAE